MMKIQKGLGYWSNLIRVFRSGDVQDNLQLTVLTLTGGILLWVFYDETEKMKQPDYVPGNFYL